MENIPDDELISAYLDGELTGADLARAERLLASQPDSRQMLEELTALRATLQNLPQQKLGADFADSVLRRAEREMLQPSAANGAMAPEAAAKSETSRPDTPPILSMSRWARPLAWSALATAAAILIMLLSPPEGERKVAQAPAQPAAAGRAANEPFAVRDAQAPDDGRVPQMQATPDARPMVATNRPESVPASSAATGAVPAIAAPGSAQSGFFSANAGLGGGRAGSRGVEVNRLSEIDVADADGGALLVVQCDVTPEVAASAGFRELLARHQIPWQEALSQEDNATKRGADSLKDKSFRSATAKTTLAESGAPGTKKGAETEAAGNQALAGKPNAAASLAKSEVASNDQERTADTAAVLVVATPSQVDATIAALADSAEYRNLRMTEVAVPTVQSILDKHLPAEISKSADGVAAKSETGQAVAAPFPTADAIPPAAAAAPAAPLAADSSADSAGKSAKSEFIFGAKQKGENDAAIADGERAANNPAPDAVASPKNYSLRTNAGGGAPLPSQRIAPHAAHAVLSIEAIAQLSRAVEDSVRAEQPSGNLSTATVPFADQPTTLRQKAGQRASATPNNPAGDAAPAPKSELGEKQQRAARMTAPMASQAPAGGKGGGGMGGGGVGFAKPAAAPRSIPATTDEADAAKAFAVPSVKQAPPAPAKEALPQTKDSMRFSGKPDQSGSAAGEENVPSQRQDVTSLAEVASPDAARPRRAIFLFRVVPAPDAPSKP